MPVLRRAQGERGSAAVELVLITPLLLLVLLFVVWLGRLAEARTRVDEAAHQAARAASLARDPVTAEREARSMAYAQLASPATCRTLRVVVDTSGFRPGGQVQATVTCTVGVRDLGPLALSSRVRVIEGTSTSPVDRYRGVTTARGSTR